MPLHIIPASREMLHSAKYQDIPVIQKRMDVLKFLDSVWTKGVPLYYWDGKELNPYIGLFHNENLAGWMLAARNIKGMKSDAGRGRGGRPGPQEDAAGRLKVSRKGGRGTTPPES